MNRPQIPGELKATICQQMVSGKWSVQEAVEISNRSKQSLERWLKRYSADGPEAFAPKPRPERAAGSRPVAPELRQVLEEALKRAPKLRTRSLTAYVQRHYGWKVPRRLVAVYLEMGQRLFRNPNPVAVKGLPELPGSHNVAELLVGFLIAFIRAFWTACRGHDEGRCRASAWIGVVVGQWASATQQKLSQPITDRGWITF